MFLTQSEIQELTQRIQRDAQARELDAMGIPYLRRRDDSLVVLRLSIETVLGVPGVKIDSSEPCLHLT